MDTQEKAVQQKYIVQNLEGINFTVKKIVTAKNNLAENLKKFGQDNIYSQEFAEKETAKLKQNHAANMQTQYASVEKSLDELRNLIKERDAMLDLNNPALSSALMIIQNMGQSLTYEAAKNINANFVHDQRALTALRDVYKARGVTMDGGINELIYSVDGVIDNLKNLAYQGIVQEGSINYFASQLAKFAVLEGATVEKMPDVVGANAALRAAAGLPSN